MDMEFRPGQMGRDMKVDYFHYLKNIIKMQEFLKTISRLVEGKQGMR